MSGKRRDSKNRILRNGESQHRDDLSLREKEKLILKDIDDEIVPRGGEMTVEQLVRKYLLQKTGVRHNTEANYNFVLNNYQERRIW